ncbi:MAG: hypothetical protein AAGI17_05210 [Planctomycetota bacterium]
MAAARSLMTGYTLYTDDHSGFTLPGFIVGETNGRRNTIVDEFGIEHRDILLVERWTYRLAPYFDYGWAGASHVNAGAEAVEDAIRSSPPGGEDYTFQYLVSVIPSFGYNVDFVGGNYKVNASDFNILTGNTTANPLHPSAGNTLLRVDNAVNPSGQIVFAPARYVEPGTTFAIEGGLRVELPRLGAEYQEQLALRAAGDSTTPPTSLNTPEDYGYIHARHAGQGVVGLLDGSADRLSPDDFLDATRWSDRAARLSDPNWRPDHPRYQ